MDRFPVLKALAAKFPAGKKPPQVCWALGGLVDLGSLSQERKRTSTKQTTKTLLLAFQSDFPPRLDSVLEVYYIQNCCDDSSTHDAPGRWNADFQELADRMMLWGKPTFLGCGKS